MLEGCESTMIIGNRIFLDSITREDLPKLMHWRNLPQYRKNFREYREINADMQTSWYEHTVVADKNTEMFAIRLIETGELIGCCGLCYINWIHRYAELSLYIGWNETYIDESGYANEACDLIFGYGYFELGLEKIWSEIYEFDKKKIKLFKKIGFEIDGTLRHQYYFDGQWWNSFIYSLLKSDYIERKETK